MGLGRALRTPDPRTSGTIELLHETSRRFRDAIARTGAQATHLVIDGTIRDALADTGVLDDLLEVAGADLLASDVPSELAALAAAAAHGGALDGRGTILVEVEPAVVRIARTRHAGAVACDRRPDLDLGRLAAIAGPRDPNRWRAVAVAAVTPLLDAVDALAMVPVVAAGGPVRTLAGLVAARRWRHPLRVADGVVIPVDELAALATELVHTSTGSTPVGGHPADLHDAAGAAALLVGVAAAAGTDSVRCTDAQRIDGHLLGVMGETGPAHLPTRIVEAAGEPSLHARQVAHLAGLLFDGLAGPVGLAPVDRQVLAAAALVHDLARADGPGHHRRGAAQVLALPVRGTDPQTLVEVAALVRAQRGRPPGGHIPTYLRLPPDRRAAVDRMVALLRLADGLDRGDDDVVTDLTVQVDGDLACVHVHGDQVDLALYGAMSHARYAERALGVPLVLRASGHART